MIVVFGVYVVVTAVVAIYALQYLKGLDERHDRERAILLNRIQAPEATAGSSIAESFENPAHIGVGLEGVDDDRIFAEYKGLTS